MKLLVIGYGVVGTAVFKGLADTHDMDAHDPPTNNKKMNYDYYDGIILCLPTPSGKLGECDDSLVYQYWKKIRSYTNTPILLKSTTSIELIEDIKHDLDVTYNPEFLTVANSKEGFMNQEFAIFGGNHARFWYDIFINAGIKIGDVRFTDIVKAAYAKYAINCFLATKVVFFNELKKTYGSSDFDDLTELISLDSRIGNSHMMVPGPDGELGFGGMCFPKDINAFAYSSRLSGAPFELLEEVIKINHELRK